MTATIINIRDYTSPEEREVKVRMIGMRAVEEALEEPVRFNAELAEYRAPNDGDCA